MQTGNHHLRLFIRFYTAAAGDVGCHLVLRSEFCSLFKVAFDVLRLRYSGGHVGERIGLLASHEHSKVHFQSSGD